MTGSLRTAMISPALLCVAVAAVHVDDQGGVSALADPGWLGWAYRLLELAALAAAGALVLLAITGLIHPVPAASTVPAERGLVAA